MSRDWTPEELRTVSDYNKRHGWMSYEEICEFIEKYEDEKVLDDLASEAEE